VIPRGPLGQPLGDLLRDPLGDPLGEPLGEPPRIPTRPWGFSREDGHEIQCQGQDTSQGNTRTKTGTRARARTGQGVSERAQQNSAADARSATKEPRASKERKRDKIMHRQGMSSGVKVGAGSMCSPAQSIRHISSLPHSLPPSLPYHTYELETNQTATIHAALRITHTTAKAGGARVGVGPW
jgi:hypothetical protein